MFNNHVLAYRTDLVKDCGGRDGSGCAGRRCGRGDDPGASAEHPHASHRGARGPWRQEDDAVLVISRVKPGLCELVSEEVMNDAIESLHAQVV